MLQLKLQASRDDVTVTFGEHQSHVLWTDLGTLMECGTRVFRDPESYGHELFDRVFVNESQRWTLQELRRDQRLQLIVEDPALGNIQWEYLRSPNGDLLASRLNLVRGVPPDQQRQLHTLSDALQILAVPVARVDETEQLEEEREYRNLVMAVNEAGKALKLRRVRPSNLSHLEQRLDPVSRLVFNGITHRLARNPRREENWRAGG